MVKSKDKNIVVKIFFSWYFFPLIIILIVFLGGVFLNKYDENKSVNNDLDKLKREIEELEKSNQDLTHLVDYFNSNFFIEKEAREKMGLKKEGEKVVVVKDGSYLSDSSEAAGDNKRSNNNEDFLPLIWWNYFFGK